ncbi:FKBP-type peptidyl-prolyl cis-trans isomerase [Neptunicella sp. SCSIO 80796]|uniref:FKBP-type peptidyl-prolyl cis-trans isomerase n=1 Tax=Neptunicella plasticusilytica TaxID=3117012 RepID=UPI003A4E4C2E
MKYLNRLNAVILISAVMTGCASTSGECTKPGAALNQVNEQVFFIQNAKKDGVIKSPHGYQYKILQRGSGKVHPESGDTVIANYVTRRLDGTVIDSGYSSALPVSKVIEGWKLALSEMVVGDAWTLYIPAKLAYGCKAQPQQFGYDEALMFDLELLKIE